jgi:hypothetical protein
MGSQAKNIHAVLRWQVWVLELHPLQQLLVILAIATEQNSVHTREKPHELRRPKGRCTRPVPSAALLDDADISQADG